MKTKFLVLVLTISLVLIPLGTANAQSLNLEKGQCFKYYSNTNWKLVCWDQGVNMILYYQQGGFPPNNYWILKEARGLNNPANRVHPDWPAITQTDCDSATITFNSSHTDLSYPYWAYGIKFPKAKGCQ